MHASNFRLYPSAFGWHTLHLPVRFSANLSVASQVTYDPAACGPFQAPNTVQEALASFTNDGLIVTLQGATLAVMIRLASA